MVRLSMDKTTGLGTLTFLGGTPPPFMPGNAGFLWAGKFRAETMTRQDSC